MIDGVPITVEVKLAAAVGAVFLAAVGLGLAATRSSSSGGHSEGMSVEATADGDAQLVSLDAPNLKTARWGLPQKLYRLHRKAKRRRKFADKGYVQWYLIDDTFPTPKYVKPETDGSGVPYYEHDGKRYLFPKDAMVASEEQGMWTIAHKENEADPINLRDPSADALPADTLEKMATLMVTTDPPGLFDKLNIDARTAFQWLIIGFVGFMILRSVLEGGLV